MAVLSVQNKSGEKISEIDLKDEIFNVEVKPHILNEIVTMQLAKRRSGTASVKRRSDIRGSGRKLFRQKGTGRARSGDIKSPLLKGGGVIFGPDPRDYSFKVPKKKKKLALKMALSSKVAEDALIVVDDLSMDEIKTKQFVDIAGALNLKNALIIINEKNRNLELSARNIPGIKVMQTPGLNVYDILKYNHLVLMESSIESIEGRLLK